MGEGAEGEVEGQRAVQRAEPVQLPGHSLWSVSQVGTPKEL